MTMFIRSQREMEVVLLDLPGRDVSPAQMADALASSLQEHGLVTQAFFYELIKARWFKKNEILRVARAWDIEMVCSEFAMTASSEPRIYESQVGNPRKILMRRLTFTAGAISISLLLASYFFYLLLNLRYCSQPTGTSSVKPVFSSTSSARTMPEVLEADASDRLAPSHSVSKKALHLKFPGHTSPKAESSAKDLSATRRKDPSVQVVHSMLDEKASTVAAKPDKTPILSKNLEKKHSVEVGNAETGDRARVGINNVKGEGKAPDVGVASIKVGDDSVIEIGNQHE